eukprot:9036806-Prorocentrum_lima.AAC.1
MRSAERVLGGWFLGLSEPHPRGGILSKPPGSFPDVDIIVAGPPCPPVTSSGSRRTWEDAWARPMD